MNNTITEIVMLKDYVDTTSLRLPVCGNKYTVNINGDITENDIKIPVTVFNDEPMVYIDWIKGENWYTLALIMSVTFKGLYIPTKYWMLLKTMYIDGNSLNVHPSNLIWKFPVGLEHSAYPGYRFIPGHSKYVINRTGDVLRHSTGSKLNKLMDKKGYVRASICPDNFKKAPLHIHRLLSLAWLPYPVNVDELQVNHIDGIKTNNNLDNLEWCTAFENNRHARLLGLNKGAEEVEVQVKNITNGVITKYSTVTGCSKALRINIRWLQRVVKRRTQYIRKIDCLVKYSSDQTPWMDMT